MSRTELLLSPSTKAASASRSCPFASNCSCVFAPAEQVRPATLEQVRPESGVTPISAPEPDPDPEARLDELLSRGWTIASADSHEIVLTRRRSMPLCTNAALLLVTGFLWTIYLVARAKHPKIETTTITL